jgi:LuxR family maltose regulon positive regulatory protein
VDKTTLLAEWAAAERPFAWLSLDDDDNDPVRFWTHVIAALQEVEPGTGADALPSVDIGAQLRTVALPRLLNDLAAGTRSLVLALDD